MTINRKTILTWEFISFVLVTLGGWIAELQGSFTGAQAVYLSAAGAGVMALSRGFAKQGADVKDWWMTSEFLVSVVGAGQAVIAQLNGTISGQTMTVVASALAFALALSRGLAKNPLVAAGLATVAQVAPQLALEPPPAVEEPVAGPVEETAPKKEKGGK